MLFHSIMESTPWAATLDKEMNDKEMNDKEMNDKKMNDKEMNDKEINDKKMITKITENLFIFSTMLSFTLSVNRYISYNYHHLSISTYNNHESKDSFKHSSIHLSKTLFSIFTY